MTDIEVYTLVTTIAVALLVLTQVVFVIVMIIVMNRIKKVADNLKQTSDMSKDFIRSLREQQMKQAPLWKLGLLAFKQAKSFKRK